MGAPASRRRSAPSNFLRQQIAGLDSDELLAAPGSEPLADERPAAPALAEVPAPVPEPETPSKPRSRSRRAAAPDMTFSGATHNLQAKVPLSLHNRYRRMCLDLKHSGEELMQREWLSGLLHEGPQSPSELRELLDRHQQEIDRLYQHERDMLSLVNGLVPRELWVRLDGWVGTLFLDERYKTSVTKTVVCLMHDGPQTASELKDLVERWRLVA